MPRLDRRKWPSWQARRPNENFTAITDSLRKSLAFRSLSGKQIQLLLLLWRLGNPLSRSKNANLPRDDFPCIDKYRPDTVFYCCQANAVRDGIYQKNNNRYHSDMKKLEKLGFIECLAKGHTGISSIYKLSGEWQNFELGKER